MDRLTAWLISVFFLVVCIGSVSAISVSSVTVDPPGQIDSGTPVTASFTVNTTAFPAADDLQLYTELDNPCWTYTIIVEGVELRRPAVHVPMFSIVGFELAYLKEPMPDVQVVVALKGDAPYVTTSGNKTIFRVTELDTNGNPITSTRFTRNVTVNPAHSIIPDFSANVTYGRAPLAVSFTDQSSGNPTGRAWFFGDEDYKTPWTQVNASAGWEGRDIAKSVVLSDGSIVLMGGYTIHSNVFLDEYKNDTWRSSDNGVTWALMNASSGWSARYGQSCVALPDGSIVLMGGSDLTGDKNDVWRSTDKGASWVKMNDSAGWSERQFHSSVATSDGTIVLMGGYNLHTYTLSNDIWQSKDQGLTWTLINASAGWPARWFSSSVALPDGTIVLMGGENDEVYFNDTWRSPDEGRTWLSMNASSGWSARFGHSSQAMPDGSIVLIGGQWNNDMWRSVDKGATWTLLSSNAVWSARYLVSSVAMPDGSIILMGGIIQKFEAENDVWRFNPAGSSDENPVHIYTKPGNYPVSLQVYNAAGYNRTQKIVFVNVTTTPSKIGVFRPSTHVNYLDYNGNDAWNGATVDRAFNFGTTGDIPVSGDWNQDGRTEIGVFRPSTHSFYLDHNGNGVWNGATTDHAFNFGLTGDIPVSGDWNLDGRTEIGVFRPSTHTFYLDYNGNGSWNGAAVDRAFNFGLNGDIPVTGDWNNGGRTEIGVFRPSTHTSYLDYNGNGAWNGASSDRAFNFGLSGDIPVPGDWNQDGRTEIGVFRPATHMFYLDANGNGAWNGGIADRSGNFGITGDRPVAGKWN